MKSTALEKQHTSVARAVLVIFHANADDPADDTTTPDGATEPDIATSPMRADGLAPATGFAFMLTAGPTSNSGIAPPAAPAGYTIKVWIRDPVTKRWGLALTTQKKLREWVSTHDFNGGDLYFQLGGSTDDTNSRACVLVMEL